MRALYIDQTMSEKPDDKNHDEDHHAHQVTAGRRLTNYFLTGLVIAAPVGLTIYITWSIIQFVDNFVKPLVPPQFNPDNYLPVNIPGFGLVIAAFAMVMLGFLAANLVGRTLVQFSEAILHKMPFVSVLYRGLKQIFETVVSQSHSNFKQVGLIQYPREGLWALVFISTDAKGEVAEKVAGEGITSVFLPTTPNPTSGFLLFLPKEEVHILDMSVEDGAKLVISAGLVSPDYQKKTAELADKSGATKKNKR